MSTPIETSSLSLQVGFRCQPIHIYEALTDPKILTIYTQSKCESDIKENGKFSLFDGSISGEYIKFTINEQTKERELELKWRQKQWEENHYSIVKIQLLAINSTTCQLKLNQTNIPNNDKFGNSNIVDQIKYGWNNYYFDRIQKVLGYGKADIE